MALQGSSVVVYRGGVVVRHMNAGETITLARESAATHLVPVGLNKPKLRYSSLAQAWCLF